VPSPIAAVAVGFVLAFWGDEFLPGVFYNTLPVVAGVVAAILYGIAATLWRPPQAAVPVASVPAETVTGAVPGSPATEQGSAA
jgi:hypothetical protein